MARLPRGTRRSGVLVAVLSLVAALAVGVSYQAISTGSASATTPGTPGTAQAATPVYTEDFQNQSTNPNGIPIQSYTGGSAAGGNTYYADPAWRNSQNQCDGWVLSANSTNTPTAADPQCATNTPSGWTALRGYATMIGAFQSGVAPGTLTAAQVSANANNNALSAFTNSQTGATLPSGQPIMFETKSPITNNVVGGHFYAVSAVFGAGSCGVTGSAAQVGATADPILQFSLIQNGTVNPTTGAVTPAGAINVLASNIDPCTAPTTLGGGSYSGTVAGATFSGRIVKIASGALQVPVGATGTTLGLRLENFQTAVRGNDLMFDLPQIIDVTPQLDKAFSPTTITQGGTSTLTFTITNTADLQAKNGWRFNDTLPTNVLATGVNSTTCSGTTVTAAANATSVAATGNLNAGQASCTISVQVKSSVPGVYTNSGCTANDGSAIPGCTTNFPACTTAGTGLCGLNPPGPTTLTVVGPTLECGTASAIYVTHGFNVYQVNPATGAETFVVTIPNTFGGNLLSVNALGITNGGTAAYAAGALTNAAAGSFIPVYRYTSTGGVQQFTGPTLVAAATNGAPARGAINPVTGIYYLSAPRLSDDQIQDIYAFDTNTNTNIGYIGSVTVATALNSAPSNGDMAFDSAGNLLMLVSNATTSTQVLRIANVPTTAGTATLSYTTIASFSNGQTVNGIAFGANGNLYLTASGSAQLFQLNPNSGAQIGSAVNLTNAAPNDLASCAPAGALQLQKNIAGRSVASDQFGLSVTGNGINIGNTATTTGSSTGLQTGATVGPLTGVPGSTYTMTETGSAGASLANYTRSIQCTDAANGNSTVATTSGVAGVWTLTFPSGTTNVPNVQCVITNTPIAPAVLDAVKTIATVNGVAATTSTQVKAGDVIVYNIAVTNTGGLSGTTVLSDVVPANTTYTGAAAQGWSCTAPAAAGASCTQTVTVAAGATLTKQYTVTVNTPVPAGVTQIANVVTTSVGTCSSCTVTNPTVPSLDTVKTIATVNGTAATTSTAVKAGDVIVYNIAVTNTGGASGTTVLSDVVPANTTYTGAAAQGWSCTAPAAAGASCTQTVTVAAGATVTKQYTVTVNTPVPAGTTQIANMVATSVGTCSSCTVTNPIVAVLDTAKTIATVNGVAATTSTAVKAGDVIVYNIKVTNTGGTSAATTLTDVVPANTTYTGAAAEGWSCTNPSAAGTACAESVTVAANSSVTKTFTLTVNTPVPAGVTQIANVVATSNGTCSSCSVANPTVPVLNTVKTIATVNGTAATTATTVQAGDVIVYNIAVTNTGGASGTTTLTDVVPANTTYTGAAAQGWSCTNPSAAGTSCTQSVAVAAGATVTKEYTLTVNTPIPAGVTQIANVVTTSTGTCSSCTVSNPTPSVLNTVKTIASVNGVAATTATQVKAGDVIVYNIAVTNTGGASATTTLTDVVPTNTTYTGAAAQGWSCTAPAAAGTSCTQSVTVAAGATVTKQYTLTVNTPIPAGVTQIANVVTTSNGTCSSCTVTNPTVPVLDTVKTIATVNGSPASTATTVKAGDVVVYNIAVTNSGGASGTTTLSDVVPTNTTYTGTAAQGWSCTAPAAAGTSCTQAVTVAAGATVTKQFTLTVNTPIPAGVTQIANVVTTSNGTCSSCTVTNPTAPVLDTVKAIATVNGAAATTSTQLKAGDVVVYNVKVTNTGGASGSATVSDTVPANTTYTGAAAEGWSCTNPAAAGTACAQTVTVAAGASVTKTYTLTVDAPIPAGVTQIANNVATSSGTCSSCTVTNPTVPALDTVKSIATVNGTAATTSTAVKPAT
jgi:uncharacterized repeat protein (TIGR01451 family)